MICSSKELVCRSTGQSQSKPVNAVKAGQSDQQIRRSAKPVKAGQSRSAKPEKPVEGVKLKTG
jgi:hypothetical protein